MKKVILEMKSPLNIGGKKISGNYTKSLCYIPGDRIRAALAKEVRMQCPLGDMVSPENKHNWIFVKDEKKCRDCPKYLFCKNFSNISISFFYPENTEVLPLTAMGYKYRKEGFFDTLIHNPSELADCQNDRLEAVYGFREGSRLFEPEFVSASKTSIDPNTRTSKEGQLFTIEALSDCYRFVGYIDNMENLGLKKGDTLRIGGSVSSGFGKMEIADIQEYVNERDLERDFEAFNLKYDTTGKKKAVSLTFLSNAKLGIERHSLQGDWDQIWKDIFSDAGLTGFDYEVKNVYTESQVYRGFDTSKKTPTRSTIMLTLMGTVILLEVENGISFDRLLEIEENGLGDDTKNGFGKIRFLDNMHIAGGIWNDK